MFHLKHQRWWHQQQQKQKNDVDWKAAFIRFQTHDCRLTVCCAKQSGARFLATDAASDAFLQSDNTFNYFCPRYFQVVWYVSGLRMIVHSFSKQFGVLWYLATDSASLTLFCPPDKPIKYSKTRLRNGRKRHSLPQVRNLINRVLESNYGGGGLT